jgi:hypothetical protein
MQMSNFFSFSLFPISQQNYVKTGVGWFFTFFSFKINKYGEPLVRILKMVLVLGAVPLAHKRKKERKKIQFRKSVPVPDNLH